LLEVEVVEQEFQEQILEQEVRVVEQMVHLQIHLVVLLMLVQQTQVVVVAVLMVMEEQVEQAVQE
tara:strand:+ start:71 stop:265 length:195 start_codon:yes stop_codon:yes gene_type:complete